MRIYRQYNPVRAKSFDLDDTLYDNRPVIVRMEQQLIDWLHRNHPVTETQSQSWWLEIKRSLVKQQPELRHNVSILRHRQLQQGLRLLGYDNEQACQVADAAMEKVHHWRSDFTVPEQTHRVMAELAARIPLVAITNGNVDLERIGLSEYFQLDFKAGPHGRAKPYPDMFQQAIAGLQVPPEQILHVGDHPVKDVAGALACGMQACWFNDQWQDTLFSPKTRLLPHVEIQRLDELLLL
ncbi:5-amino-6-(5-phospho-D-ribitylamino)uracil phosphatase YigB [Vibrio sp.]|uniref:5-amino-6-(5-phospho-D-ribitylamino)uracil phosphatase YigB n=1 Tax=Vibrio sp. TaxID=678 RepID=UPI003D13D567